MFRMKTALAPNSESHPTAGASRARALRCTGLLFALTAACASSEGSKPAGMFGTPVAGTPAKAPTAPGTPPTVAPPTAAPTMPPAVPPPGGTPVAGTPAAPPVVAPMAPPTNTPAQPVAGAGAEMPAPSGAAEQLMGECPSGFEPKEGTNTNFPAEGAMRQFVATVPSDVSTPRPVLVVLTGTVESTVQSMTTNSRLTADFQSKGWILLGPVRACSSSPEDNSSSCNAAGQNGWNWRPWNEGAAAGNAGMKWWGDEGPDARFMKSMVKCAAKKWPIDAKRLFVIGISSGGTMTNRLLTFQSDFWAGGVPESGEWYVNPNNQAVMQDPTKIYTGRCCPLPELPAKLGAMFIITVWGGPNDNWMNLSDYSPTCQAGSNYYSSQDDVTHVACSGTHGHRWQPVMGFNAWIEKQMMAHPKGSTVAPNNTKAYKLPDAAPMPFTCEVGRYTTIYGR